MKIAFIWQGVSRNDVVFRWQDGLWAALSLISEDGHFVELFEPWQIMEIKSFCPDVILYWEAPCTAVGRNAQWYNSIRRLKEYKKALLFAGGQIKREWCDGFDMFFVESEIDEAAFEKISLFTRRAFGVNEKLFCPQKQPKIFDGIIHATFALWKRHDLFAQALKDRGLAVGRTQEHEPQCYQVCQENGSMILSETPPSVLVGLINASHAVVNTSSFWGGGQRCTLEAMACNVPPIVMSDSPKNVEFVEGAKFGLVVDPEVGKIIEAVNILKSEKVDAVGRDYIMSKWTSRHYANALLNGIIEIL